MEQQMVQGMEAFNTRLFEMERRTVALEGERLQLINEVTVLRGQVGQNQTAAAGLSSEFNANHWHEGGWQAGPLLRRSHQVRRLVVQGQVVHGCSRLSVPAAVRRGGIVSSPDLERSS